jgi:sec-independent protein translocase protein TatA
LFGGIGGSEVLVVVLVVLLLFGSKRIPEFARTMGKVVHEVRKAVDQVRHEVESTSKLEPPGPGSDKAG